MRESPQATTSTVRITWWCSYARLHPALDGTIFIRSDCTVATGSLARWAWSVHGQHDSRLPPETPKEIHLLDAYVEAGSNFRFTFLLSADTILIAPNFLC